MISKRVQAKPAVWAVAAAAVVTLLTACSGSSHPGSASSASSTPVAPTSSATSTPGSVVAPLLPGTSISSSAQPWSKAYAGQQFSDLLNAFNSASGGSQITNSSSFADYLQYSQRIADACDPFLNGLRAGHWPENAQLSIVQFTRLQQTVCDVELARGQSGTLAQYKEVPAAPANADQQLLTLRLKIYSELGI